MTEVPNKDKIKDKGYRLGLQLLVSMVVTEAAKDKGKDPVPDMMEIIEEFVDPDSSIAGIPGGGIMNHEEHLYCIADAFAIAIMMLAGRM